jgi:lactoylglutathione lyase
MKRFHAHIAVDDLAKSVDFYSKLFGQSPTVERTDYAKWMLEDPRINFAVSARGHAVGLNHFGFQADNEAELQELRQLAGAAAGKAVLDQGETICCYAVSTKHWTVDPSGIAWEHYQTMGEVEEFGSDTVSQSGGCCVPVVATASEACCVPGTQAGGCCNG